MTRVPQLLIQKRLVLFREAYKAQSRFLERFAFDMEADGYDMSGAFRYRDFLGYEINRIFEDVEKVGASDKVDCPPISFADRRRMIAQVGEDMEEVA